MSLTRCPSAALGDKMPKIEINPEALARVQARQLSAGSHEDAADGMCVMEATAYVAGEPHSDAPQCACPVITKFMVAWNDSLPDDATRTRLLAPLIPVLVGTRSTPAVEERRSYMALDWLIRVHTPKWLDMSQGLADHAAALRGLDEIADLAGAKAAGGKVNAAWDAARDAARASAWAAARAAACTAARDAALASARAAACTAALASARAAAAWEAAWDAARASARAAARASAMDALQPTTEWLQGSAVDLIKRMAAVGG